MNKMNWSYIAGFIDGEGSIVKRKYGFAISIPQTNLEVLEEMKEFIGYGNIYKLTKRKSHWKDAWTYMIQSQGGVYYVIINILDSLIVKRQVAIKVLPSLKKSLDLADARKEIRNYRIKKSIKFRNLGWTYQRIGEYLKIDRSHVRRLILSTI